MHETPGHAEDGLYRYRKQWSEVSGSIGGEYPFCWLMGGAPRHFTLAKEKVRQVILSLADETVITPGHGLGPSWMGEAAQPVF